MIGGQLGHEFVGKLAIVVVGRGRERIAVHGVVAFIGRSEIRRFAAGGVAAAGFRLGEDVGMPPVAALIRSAAVVVDADEGPGLGFLFVRIDGQLGVEFGEAGLDGCNAFVAFGCRGLHRSRRIPIRRVRLQVRLLLRLPHP